MTTSSSFEKTEMSSYRFYRELIAFITVYITTRKLSLLDSRLQILFICYNPRTLNNSGTQYSQFLNE